MYITHREQINFFLRDFIFKKTLFEKLLLTIQEIHTDLKKNVVLSWLIKQEFYCESLTRPYMYNN